MAIGWLICSKNPLRTLIGGTYSTRCTPGKSIRGTINGPSRAGYRVASPFSRQKIWCRTSGSVRTRPTPRMSWAAAHQRETSRSPFPIRPLSCAMIGRILIHSSTILVLEQSDTGIEFDISFELACCVTCDIAEFGSRNAKPEKSLRFSREVAHRLPAFVLAPRLPRELFDRLLIHCAVLGRGD